MFCRSPLCSTSALAGCQTSSTFILITTLLTISSTLVTGGRTTASFLPAAAFSFFRPTHPFALQASRGISGRQPGALLFSSQGNKGIENMAVNAGTDDTAESSLGVSFLDFLKETKAHAAGQGYRHLSHVAIGNEAGDTDSIVSALTYPYISANMNGKKNTPWMTPVLSISKTDLQTQRPETLLLFQLAGLDATFLQSHLVDINDILGSSCSVADAVAPQAELDREETATKVTLLDHNRLDPKLEPQQPPSPSASSSKSWWKVVEILDHHMDTQSHQDTCPESYRTIAFDSTTSTATVASTCTLVAEAWAKKLKHQQLQDDKVVSFPSASVAMLLLGTILLDSVNMSPQAGKGTPRDAQAIQELVERTPWSDLVHHDTTQSIFGTDDSNITRPNLNQLFNALQNAKFDIHFWQGLSVRNALRLDYKAFAVETPIVGRDTKHVGPMVLGFSSVLLSWSDFVQKPHLWTQIQHHMNEEAKVHVLIVMLTCSVAENDGSSTRLQRELLLCANAKPDDETSAAGFTHMMQDLRKNDATEYKLQLAEHPEADTAAPVDKDERTAKETMTVHLFQQGNAKASRKQVAPILLGILEKLCSNKE